MDNNNVLREVARLQTQGKEFVLATIVEGFSGSPGRSGFKLVYLSDETTCGTLGGGKLEFDSVAICKKTLRSRENSLHSFELTEEKMNMGCGGEVKVFFEYFAPRKTFYLFGCGHLCQSLSPILSSLGFRLVAVDNRSEYAMQERLPFVDEVICEDYLQFLDKWQVQSDDAVAVFTHGHSFDYEILEKIYRQGFDGKYFGLIGSARKVAGFLKKLEIKKDEPFLKNFYSPIGLNVAKVTTAEIAVSIAAEVLAVYNGVDEVSSSCKRLYQFLEN